jgi:adenosylmethionine-8-amino-7-oxononanoate aminotransferase
MGRRADFSLTASPGSLLEVAAAASGARIVDEDGRSYLDACGGAMVMSLGHCHPRLVEVVQRQVAELSFTYRFSFRNGPMLELAQELRAVSPLEDTWCFFNSSGSESVESAIQLALRYWQLRGHAGKTDLISRWPSFHGSTLGALSLSGSKWRAFYEPILAKHPVAPVPNADIRRRRAPEEEATWAAGELEDEIMRRGAQNVAAVVIEPVTGASGAAIVPPPGYIAQLRAICDRHDLLLVFDETITAFGRTGRWFAADHWPEAKPDIITFAKGVTSGIVPFSGVLVTGAVAELFEQSPQGFPYGHTFSGYPLGCAVAAEAIRVIRDEDLVAESRRKGALLRAGLDALATVSPRIGDVRGLGLLQGIELVTDRETLAPPPGAASRLVAACRERGLMIYACPTPMGATTIEAVMLAPPLTIADAELDEVVAILGEALAATHADAVRAS